MEQAKDIFGKRLLEIRESKGESQQELADSIGITRQSLSRYELGERTANIDLLKKIAAHYNVCADYLLGLTDNKTTNTDLQAVCGYTGLNEEAVEGIIKNNCPHRYPKDYKLRLEILNIILSNRDFWGIITEYSRMSKYKEEIIKLQEATDTSLFKTITDAMNNAELQKLFMTTQFIDICRYSVTKAIEKISDKFDIREIRRNGKHNPKNK